jgi:hypothetical protein
VSTDSLERYRTEIQDKYHLSFYRPRRFTPLEDWNRLAKHGVRSSAFLEHSPTLETLLEHRASVVLGEPGSGKSTVANAGMLAAVNRGWVPVFARLGAYSGSLSQTFEPTPPGTSEDQPRLYILDGLDDLPREYLNLLAEELASLGRTESTSRFLLTSRQAFFVALGKAWKEAWPVFCLADLDESDVESFSQHHGVDVVAFSDALSSARLEQEAVNPFNLNALLHHFKQNGFLPQRRSEAVGLVVDSVLAGRPTSNQARDRRALRMLAVAMEISGHNHLLETQCCQVLERALDETPEGAAKLLDELTRSILVRVGDKYAFQMTSFGEYLAAEDLAEIREPDRVLALMRVPNSVELSQSWGNCASYLVETHNGVRQALVNQAPEWVVAASPHALRPRLKTRVVERALKNLSEAGVYLHRHPTMRAERLARLVTQEMIPSLRAAAQGSDPIAAANSLLLLGLSGDSWAADRALALAVDMGALPEVRLSALIALEACGSSADLNSLLAIPASDQLGEARVEAAAAMMAPDDVGRVLTAADQQQRSVVSNLYRRMDLFRSTDDVDRVLLSLVTGYAKWPKLGYFRTLWRDVVRLWKAEWATLVAELFSRWTHDEHDSAVSLADAFQGQPDVGSAVGSALLKRIIAEPGIVGTLPSTVYRLIPSKDLEGIELTEELKLYLRAYGNADVRTAIGVHPPTPAEEAAIAKIEKDEQDRAAQLQRGVDEIKEANDEAEFLSAFAKVRSEHWPELQNSQLEVLSQAIQRKLLQLDLEHQIVWTGQNSWTMPRQLRGFLALLDRYQFRLEDDRPLVWALTAHEVNVVIQYQGRFGLSEEAWKLMERLLSAPDTIDQALDGIVRFVAGSRGDLSPVLDALSAIASSGRSSIVRRLAVNALIQRDVQLELLVDLQPKLSQELMEQVEFALLRRGHRPTTERKLQALIQAPDSLSDGEVQMPASSPLDWLSSVRNQDVWPKLEQLRKLALERSLPIVTARLSDAMSSIDELRFADVIEAQVDFAPADWRAYEVLQAARHRRDGSIKATKNVPFDIVLERMSRATTLNRFKIWVEGPGDVAVVAVLLKKYAGACSDNITVQALGGWANFLAPEWSPDRLGDGCSDFIVLFDGDRARDFGQPGRPIRPEVKRAIEKLDNAGVDHVILEAYAIENYFPEAAFTAVLGVIPSGIFPLDQTRTVEGQVPGYHKRVHNRRLAQATSAGDLVGTDLAAFFTEVADRACPDDESP